MSSFEEAFIQYNNNIYKKKSELNLIDVITKTYSIPPKIFTKGIIAHGRGDIDSASTADKILLETDIIELRSNSVSKRILSGSAVSIKFNNGYAYGGISDNISSLTNNTTKCTLSTELFSEIPNSLLNSDTACTAFYGEDYSYIKRNKSGASDSYGIVHNFSTETTNIMSSLGQTDSAGVSFSNYFYNGYIHSSGNNYQKLNFKTDIISTTRHLSIVGSAGDRAFTSWIDRTTVTYNGLSNNTVSSFFFSTEITQILGLLGRHSNELTTLSTINGYILGGNSLSTGPNMYSSKINHLGGEMAIIQNVTRKRAGGSAYVS